MSRTFTCTARRPDGTGNDLEQCHLRQQQRQQPIRDGTATTYLYGYDGNDTLDGGTGNDSMAGGVGDDSYVVDSAGDVVSEAAGAGTDRVNASVNYTLGANVENLTLSGTATSGTGNDLNNIIYGNSNANTLSGLAGNDTLYGYDGNDTLYGGNGNDYPGRRRPATIPWQAGAGNDTYVVDSAGDVVSEDGRRRHRQSQCLCQLYPGRQRREPLPVRHGDQRDRQRPRQYHPGNSNNNTLYGNNGNDN